MSLKRWRIILENVIQRKMRFGQHWMKAGIRDLIQRMLSSGISMKTIKTLPLVLFLTFALSFGASAELEDQGLNSIMVIIDKAIDDAEKLASADGDADETAVKNATGAIINLSRTLGTLSYSRLQCGEAGVLAEFTQRVQQMPDESRDSMRDAFQEGFDKSKEETTLLSQDECDRLTQSRKRSEKATDANVKEDPNAAKKDKKAVEEVEVVKAEDPKFRQIRVAELAGQLAYKRKFCQDETIFNRDYNNYLESIPTEYREEAKTAYWKGYKRGKRLNKNLTSDMC
ncbi:MAG: putative secreted protein [Planctomycetota bacterium]|jgi:predicted secreted protein